MKNFNLTKRLFMDSHEKQSPQRFGRYAAILIMLLSLGVGQMWAWATNVYLNGNFTGDNWNKATYQFTWWYNSTDGKYYMPVYATGSTQYFRLWTNNHVGPSTNNTAITTSGSSAASYSENNWKYTGSAGIINICVDQTGGKDWNPWVWYERPTIKFKHPWNGGSWTEVDATDNNNGTYKYKGQYGNTASFNAGPSGDLKIKASATTVVGSPTTGDYCLFEWNASGYKWNTGEGSDYGTFTITKLCGLTYNGNGRTGGTAVPSALSDQKYGSSVTLSSDAMTKTGYTLTGWNTANDGSGTHYDLGASFTFSNISNTLYAEWTQTITVDKNTGTSAGSMSICFNAGSLKSFTAATKTDWILDSYWTSSDESGSKIINYDASTGTPSLVSNVSGYTSAAGKWTRTATTKLYAHWKQTYTVTYNANYPASATSTSGSVPKDATEYASGATVTVKTNSGSLAAGGYTFAGWQTEPTGGTSYVAGSGTFSITEPTTLYAKWTENLTTVTVSVSPSGSGTLTVDAAAFTPGNTTTAGVVTNPTVVATAQPGYTFSSWSAGGNATGTSSTNTYTLKGNGNGSTGTLTATFSRTYAYLEGRMTVYNAARTSETHTASSKEGWDESSTRIEMEYDETNHRFYRHTYKTPAELKAQISSQDQWFSVKTGTVHNSFASGTVKAYHPSSNTNIATAGTKYSAPTTATTYNFKFTNTATDGYAIIYFDQSDVWYTLEHTLNYNGNGSTSGSAPAEAYYDNGTNATAASNPFSKTNYSFGGWNTDQYITGTNYAAGASVPMSTNTTLYAKWTRDITLNQNGATANGSTSVTATYNCATLPPITAPSKTGYTFGGWNTANDGSGNIVINTDGEFLPITDWCDSQKRFTRTESSATLYAKWTQTITLNANTGNHGSGSNTTATVMLNATALSGITHCTPATGYALEGYYTAETGGTKVLNANGTFAGSSVTDYITSSKWIKAGATTLYAHYTAKSYTLTFAPNGGTVTPTSASVTYDAAISNAPVPTKTGYNFTGYNTAGGTSITTNTGVFKANVSDYTDASTHWVHDGNATITAQWSPKTYTITLSQSGETGYGSAGTASVTATYNAALPSIASLPTAANGYAFMGYYTDHNGAGTQWYDATGTKKVASYTTAGATTLYAYFKKAEITAITFDADVVEASGTVSFAVTVSPTPTGTTKLCFTVLHSNDNPLAEQPTITYNGGTGKYSFTAPAASGTYKIETVLKTGSSCAGGTELDTEVASFQVAGLHTVTVRYKCGDEVIKASTTATGRPLDWSGAMTAPDIFGYTFSSWEAGDGVTLTDDDGTTTKTTTTAATIKIKAIYDGSLTANYNQNAIIYFKNTLGWSDVYVNLYSSSYWDNPKGSGNQSVTNRNKHMTRIGETDVWYFDYGAASISPSLYVSFTSASQDNTQYFWKANPGVNVVYPANYPDAINTDKSSENGFKAATPMFVPLAGQSAVVLNSGNSGKANYYNAGYWTKYTPGTGYTLEIYNSAGNVLLKSVEFTSEDELMPMKAVVDLEAGQTYKYQLRRGGTDSYGIYYGNSGTMTYSNHGQGTAWEMINTMSPSFSMCGITTNAAGDYTFNLSYSGNSSTPPQYRLRMAVDYPIKSGDYRVIYKDGVQTRYKASAIIPKVNNGKDTVSFFIRPGNASKDLKIQQATVASGGAITWSAGTAITSSLSSLTKDSVYNICLKMDGSGAISVENVEPYTGNYYIRVDAANSKWDNYRSDPDHLMTYSEYSITHGGYSHYYCHWVDASDSRKNVKFCIANDYSPSISDTLTRETASGDWTNITYYIESNGDLKRNANVRFMWNQATNKVSRAYVDGAQDDIPSFLVLLSADGKIKNQSGTGDPLTQVTFEDKENWIYEQTIKAQPNAKIRLKSTWGETNVIEQYFKGTAGGTTETLVGGSGDNWYKIRLLYDFKTNRLVAAYVPEEGTIESDIQINADVMFIREHQGDIAQLTFGESGKISKITTAYGVMRFNKWTLANKSKEAGHAVLPSPASIYERSLFWISFPFKVKLSEVFGFGKYGEHWAIQYYDGAKRAEIGHFAENGSFWKWMNRNTDYLEPNQGYLLAIDLDLLGESSDVWGPASRSEQIELYFPSFGKMPDITNADVVQEIPGHVCTINWAATQGLPDTGDPRTSYNRTIFDSHWNVMSVPTYVNTDDVSFANTTWTGDHPSFLYTWNEDDNTITATSASGYTFHAMHAYMVQYGGDITWSASSGSPAGIVARRTYAEKPSKVEFRLELQQNEKMIDRTYVALSDDEEVSVGFKFGEDMTKEYNRKSSIYTFIPGEAVVAGNTLPMSDQTTIVPVGVDIKDNGNYTFAIPNGTSGIGVILIDNETGIHLNLGALNYTVFLEAGTYDERFVLEISPIKKTTTGLEPTSDSSMKGKEARKMMIDDILYIVKDGKLFDARGARVQ